MDEPIAFRWRRLDVPGRDECTLRRTADGWTLEGTACFGESGELAELSYVLECDGTWQTRRGLVQGHISSREQNLRIARTTAGDWAINGKAAPQVQGCVDLDFGFTPSTNLTQIRRVALEVGQAADLPVAWLDADAAALQVLHQRYARLAADEYLYEAPRFHYRAVLRVGPAGFVLTYPTLWEADGAAR